MSSKGSNARSYAASGGGGDDNRRGGKLPKTREPPKDGLILERDKAKLIAALLAILAVANVGRAPSSGDIGKMYAWVNGLLNSNHHVRSTFYSPGARAFADTSRSNR